MKHLVAGTAGHIDHGKTVLIRALTGIDTDRLPEEKRRGISIELGYAYLDLPDGTRGLHAVPPLGYLEVLDLMRRAKVVLTDSGGVQEETCILGVPCVTLRDNTERPETLDAGSNILAGTNPDKIRHYTWLMLNRDNGSENPFGDGEAGKRIVGILKRWV